MTTDDAAPRPAAPVSEAAPPAAGGAPRPGPGRPAATGPAELGGPKGPEPTRYGDWERDGRCVDF
jgi:hypothetical protein